MWPWEHVMLGYVLYSTYAHVWRKRAPSDRAALVVVIASVLPDLVDKPLSWQFAVLPGGRSLAHSFLFAVPAVVLVALFARRAGADDVGSAFAVAYLSHLPADALYPSIVPGQTVEVGYLLWPIGSASGSSAVFVTNHLLDLVVGFSALVVGPGGWRILVVEAVLLTFTVGLWIVDGRPGPGAVRRGLGWIARA